MFEKSYISKRVGFTRKSLKIPSMEQVESLYEKAKQGDVNSAVTLFSYYRFCPSPQNDNELKAINKIVDGVKELIK